ncbi:aldo/keto reductase [Kineococcus sp. SYSU DK003]|uniref:aldo/keto reductase n=1 Tax=Kineococcus sp. SYSU DK003 TaxID=3383124 RepID=UPI003D7CF080
MPSAELVLGTMTFGDTADEAISGRLLAVALDAGVTEVDTTNAHVGGLTEEIRGRLLAGRRGRVRLASKVGMPHPDPGSDAPLSAAALHRCVQGSRRRRGTDPVRRRRTNRPRCWR